MRHPAASALLAICLAPLLAGAQTWSLETVQPYGVYYDLAVDAAGEPHIVFSNCQAWEDCDPVVPGQAALTYGRKSGGAWTFETVAPHPQGDLLSLVVDGAGTPHVAYKDSTYQMRYGYRGPGGWQLEDLHHELLPSYRASPSLVLDAAGAPHIAYIEREHIRYAFRTGAAWMDEVVTGSYMDNWSARSPIAIDGSGNLHVGAWRYDTSAVFFTRGASTWTYEALNGAIGWSPWMVLDGNDAAHFVHHGAGLLYATNATGSWIEETVDAQGDNTADDIALDGDGRPHVVYTTSALVTFEPPWLFDAQLWHAWRDDGVWRKTLIHAVTGVDDGTMLPRLEIDDAGTLHLLHHDPETAAMRYGTLQMVSHVPGAPRAANARIRNVRPNPFNPATQVVYHLDAPAAVALTVFDVRGRRVRSLVRAQLPAGEHTVRWDGRDDAGGTTASGVYFVRLQSGTGADTRRVVLLK
jgi:hypothetical protein